MSFLVLPFGHFLKVSYDRTSRQLVNDLVPRFPLSSPSLTSASFRHFCPLVLREQEVSQVHRGLPRYRSAAKKAVNEGAALARLRIFQWNCSE